MGLCMSAQVERIGNVVLPEQLSAAAAAQEYADFLAKFEAKKTTDDCFTPPEVFAAVHRWAEAEYGLQGRRIVRPFHPGGDFVAFDYQPGDVVLDNPPFSILAKIRRFYDAQGIDYFLFAPALSLFSTRAPTMLVVGESVEYANGAKVATSFITSLQPSVRVRTAPALAKALRAVRPKRAAPLPKYAYPHNVRNAALLQRVSDVDFSISAAECEYAGAMDAQREAGKTIFGGGIIMSDAKAAELQAAERRAAELQAAEWRAAELRAAGLQAAVEAIEWGLSQREREIVTRLNDGSAAQFDGAVDVFTLSLFEGASHA